MNGHEIWCQTWVPILVLLFAFFFFLNLNKLISKGFLFFTCKVRCCWKVFL